ncbi:MAG: hypothetical protein RLN76_05000 [Phycisphaeraceae bacterium]
MTTARTSLESHLEHATNRHNLWLTALAIFIIITHFQWWWHGSGDQMNYLSIARHFALGEIARFDEPTLRYAPGYALIIAPTFWVMDRPFLLINLIHTVFLLAMLRPMTRWFTQYAGRASVLLSTLVVVNLSLWFYTQRPLSEAVFVPWLILTGLLLQKSADAPRLSKALPWLIAAMLATILLVMIRQLGVFVLSALSVVLLIRTLQGTLRWWDAALRLTFTALPACLSIIALSHFEQANTEASTDNEMSYVDHLLREDVSLLERLALCTHLRISEIGRMMMPGMRTSYAQEGDWLDINMLIYSALFLLLAWGWWRIIRRRTDVLMWFLPFYLGFLLFWPYEAATRYAIPLLPMLVLALWGAVEPLKNRRLTILAIAATLHLLVTLGYWGIELTRMNTTAQWASAQAVADQTRDDPDSIVVRGVSTPWQYRLRFITNRNIAFARTDEQLKTSDARWIAVGDNKPTPPGWLEVSNIDNIRLYRRPDTKDPTLPSPHPVQ